MGNSNAQISKGKNKMSGRKRIPFLMDALNGGGADKAVVNIPTSLAQRNEFDPYLILAIREDSDLNCVYFECRGY